MNGISAVVGCAAPAKGRNVVDRRAPTRRSEYLPLEQYARSRLQARSAGGRIESGLGNDYFSAASSCCSMTPVLTQSESFGTISIAVP